MNEQPLQTVMLESGPTSKETATTQESLLDPNNPSNWSKVRKGVHFGILQIYVMLVFATMCSTVPCWSSINLELGISYSELNNGYSAQMAGLATGCILFVPLSFRFGFRPVWLVTSLLTVLTALWWANMQHKWEWYVINLISGLAGAPNEALMPSVIVNMFHARHLGLMNGIYLAFQLTGNYFGPVTAGYIVDSLGWRWVWWWCTILQGAITLIMVFALEESAWYTPTLQGLSPPVTEAAANNHPESSEITKTPSHGTELTMTPETSSVSIPMKSYRQRLALSTPCPSVKRQNQFPGALYRPFRFLLLPAITICAVQFAGAILCIAVAVTTQGTLYPLEPYYSSAIGVGNMNIPPAIGSLIGAVVGGAAVDKLSMRIARARGSVHEPETRLWLSIVATCASVGGLLMFGLTIAKGQPWIINAVGVGILGCGITMTMDIATTYAQETYPEAVSDAFIAVSFCRNIIAAAVTYGMQSWVLAIGYYNVFVSLGCILALFGACNASFLVWGRYWRRKSAQTYNRLTRTS